VSQRESLTVIYGINLAPAVTVCLHCGEIGPDGALFCAKCGYTLPQVDANAGTTSAPLPPPPPGGGVGGLRLASAAPVSGPYVVPAAPGAAGPIAPPPSGKFCVRCRTIISRAAVYCPVCQQPQTP